MVVWILKLTGTILMIGVVVRIWLNKDYGSVTGAMHQNPLIAIVLTAGICSLYYGVMSDILSHGWFLAMGFKPILTMVTYAGVVVTSDSQDSTLHLVLAGCTFTNMSIDLLLMGGGYAVVACAVACMALVVAMVVDTKLKHLKALELVFGVVFPIGVLLSDGDLLDHQKSLLV